MGAFRVAIQNTANKIYQYAEPNLTLVGWMGLFGFPAYYYVWTYLFPQPYESLLLRTICSLMFSVIVFRNHLPEYFRRYMPFYYLAMTTLCLPLFFFFMLLKNEWSTIWAMSFMASIFLHILLVHQTKIVLAQAAISITLALFFVYGTNLSAAYQDAMWAYVPIFAFTYVFGNLFYFRNQVGHESKVSIAKTFGAGIAHEMRNPLSALQASNEVLRSILPNAKEGGGEITLSAHEVCIARDVLEDADEVIKNGNEAIDLLLTSIDENRVSTSTFKKHSAKKLTENSLSSFAYKTPKDKSLVNLVIEQDFELFGSDTLIKYALYNLLKNSFYYQSDNNFQITITLRRYQGKNQIEFKDNGAGISPEILENVFKDFYTFGKTGSYGLGLPFCRKVMNAVGGEIECRSQPKEWTIFTLTFPDYKSEVVDRIKLDLMKSKSVLYIGRNGRISALLNESAFYKGFRFVLLEADTACKKQEYEFEFDLIFIDLDLLFASPNTASELVPKLHFTEGRVVPLFSHDTEYHDDFEPLLSLYPIEKGRMVLEPGNVLDELFFEHLEPNRSLIPKKREPHGKTIVLADDNRSLRAYTSILLEQQGFEVIQANNGLEVIEKLKHSPVDLVIMDIEMPSLNGLEAANAIRHSELPYANVPILGHTGDSTSVALEKIHQSGMNDYVIKPAATHVLLDKIANWI